MKVLLTLVLALCWLGLHAQQPSGLSVYTDAQARFRLRHPSAWQLRQSGNQTIFAPPGAGSAAPEVTLVVAPLPDSLKLLNGLARGQQDSLWRGIQRLPQAQVLRLDQHDAGSYQELRYDYTYAAQPQAGRIHVLGRRLWQGGYVYQLEYRAAAGQEGRYRQQAQQLVASFAFTSNAPATSAYTEQQCDDKMYGIAALRYDNDVWEDDCRTIHEFSASDPARPPKIHRAVLPFQSYALAKGFDNALYSATKAPTNAPEYVYRYDPATRQGRYTNWRLPAQGPGNVWIAAATDEHGDLYFSTSDASKLVKISPKDSAVTLLWTTDPARQAPYYAAIGFAGAGSHGNFGLDEGGTLYQIYSTDGSLIKVDLKTRQAATALLPLTGLPERGGYSDLLFQNDAAGRRRLYLAGPTALYWVDMASQEAHFVRRGVYTDLAGCNVFRGATELVASATVWRGRVLDALTFQPLPQAQLQLGTGAAKTVVPLDPQGAFAFPAETSRTYTASVQLPGYLSADSTYTTSAGPHVQDILVQPLSVGAILRLNNVQFEQGTTRLLLSSYPALDQLLAILKQNPKMTIELRGHTDNVGSPEKNQVLSEQRVSAVKIYLVGLGIAPKRITGLGLGGTEPLASNAREATRKLNRRVEFRVTGVK